MLELDHVEGTSCPGCGWHESLADSDDSTFAARDHKCPVCAGRTQWERHLAAGDDRWRDAHKDSPPVAPQPSDGRWTRMTLLSPEEAQRQRGGDDGDTG